MNTLNSTATQKIKTGLRAAPALLLILLCLGGAWKIAAALASPPGSPASNPFVYQVKDINTTPADIATSRAVLGSTLYFAITSPNLFGNAIWKSDGSEAGTVKLQNQIYTDNYTAGNAELFFTGVDRDTNDRMLFFGDGTPAGTKELKRWPEDDCTPGVLVYTGAILFFRCQSWTGSGQLWVSDGTVHGTIQIATFQRLDYMLAMGSTLYFPASNTGYATQLWKSDGTHLGTKLVKDLDPGSDLDTVYQLANINGTLFFSASNGVDMWQLWKSNGKPAGTVKIMDFPFASFESIFGNLTNVNGAAFFSFNGTAGSLWKSDGTAAGTVKVKDIQYIPLYNFVSLAGTLFFTAGDDTSGVELWKSDGSEAGTLMVKDINPGSGSSLPGNLVLLDGVLFFSAEDGVDGVELWKSDGTAEGTVLVKDITPGAGSTNFQALVGFNGRLFAFISASTDLELWQSDGTTAGTAPVKHLASTTQSSYPTGMRTFQDQAFFAADDGVHGFELWKSDGTEQGTLLVQDIYSGSASAFFDPGFLPPGVGFMALTVGDTLFFAANDGVHGNELWKTDGTAGGTVMVKDIFPGEPGGSYWWFTAFKDELFFASNTYSYSPALWKSDGTLTGTVPLKEFSGSGAFLSPILAISDTLYFVNDDELYSELWKTDGTISGTQLVLSFFNIGLGSLTDVNGTLFFVTSGKYAPHAAALWKSDGTITGTVLIKGSEPYNTIYGIGCLQNVNGALFFEADSELWKSDGTVTGTVKIKDFYSFAGYCSVYQGKYFFTGNDGVNGDELWQSDGTESGTFMVKDLNPAGDATPGPYVLFDGILYFPATGETGGKELWRSDGTAAGTYLMVNIIIGDAFSNPPYFDVAGERLFFAANDGATGEELWVVNSGVGLQPVFLPVLLR